MKFVKSKNILIASILSMFLVQIINSVYIPIAKPVAKPAAHVAKTPAAKPVAKLTAKSASKDITDGCIIDPFLTFDMVSDTTDVTFFSKFTDATAVSNKDAYNNIRQAKVNQPDIFLPALFNCVNTIYNDDGSSNFNDLRYIYGQFSNNGAILMLYKDQAHTNVIGTFALPNTKLGDGTYIYKLVWYTDAHMPLSKLKNDPTRKVDPINGNIRGEIIFRQETALNNGPVIIGLVNPNASQFKELSQIADFTGLTFEDANNKTITIDKATTDKLNTIYNGKNNPATSKPPITPNDYIAQIDNLVKQALINPQQSNLDYAHTDFLSQYYGPKILISFVSQQIKIEAYYNVMWAGLTAVLSGRCVINYVKRNKYESSSIKAINIKKIKSTSLSAPIVKDQLFFYFDAGFDSFDATVAQISKNNPSDPGNPYANVDCNCYKSKSCNW